MKIKLDLNLLDYKYIWLIKKFKYLDFIKFLLFHNDLYKLNLVELFIGILIN